MPRRTSVTIELNLWAREVVNTSESKWSSTEVYRSSFAPAVYSRRLSYSTAEYRSEELPQLLTSLRASTALDVVRELPTLC